MIDLGWYPAERVMIRMDPIEDPILISGTFFLKKATKEPLREDRFLVSLGC